MLNLAASKALLCWLHELRLEVSLAHIHLTATQFAVIVDPYYARKKRRQGLTMTWQFSLRHQCNASIWPRSNFPLRTLDCTTQPAKPPPAFRNVPFVLMGPQVSGAHCSERSSSRGCRFMCDFTAGFIREWISCGQSAVARGLCFANRLTITESYLSNRPWIALKKKPTSTAFGRSYIASSYF